MAKKLNERMFFNELDGLKVQVDFNGGDVSSDAGLLFLRQVESEMGIIEKVASVIDDKRHPGYVQHSVTELLAQRVFQIAAGYEDGNDSNELRQDPILKIACEKSPSTDDHLASQPTICRFENAPSRKTLYRMAQALLDIFVESYKEPPEGIIIDIDDTADLTYGNQQLALFNGYYDHHCYLPIHIYEGKSGRLITTILRPGKRPSGREIVSILKRIVQRIRKAWPEVGIVFRGDSHYSAPEVYDFCKEHNIKFILGLKTNQVVARNARQLVARAKELYEAKNKPIKLYGEFHYQAGSWAEPHRVLVKAEHNDKGPNTRFVVTNLEHSHRRFVYESIYCGRGAMELMIKEHKNHLASDRTSCSSFEANQFRLFLHSIVYILMHAFREKHLKNTAFAKAQFNTIRMKLLKIGARVYRLKTKIKIHLPESFPFKNEFMAIFASCYSARFA